MTATIIRGIAQVFIVLGAWTGFAEAAQHVKHQPTGHKFVVTFEETRLEDIVAIRKYLIDTKIVEDLLNGIAGEMRLPRDVPVTFKDCEGPDANWDPEKKSITYCYDLIKLYDRGYDDIEPDKNKGIEAAIRGANQETVVAATTMFLLLHELGHGLVDLFDLPITGREEDAVDQFATVVFLDSDDEDPSLKYLPLVAANFFKDLDADASAFPRAILADEHSLGQQRYYNVMCLVLGSDDKTFEPMLTAGVALVNQEYEKDPNEWDPEKIVERLQETDSMNILPYERAVRCDSEYARYSSSWERIIEQAAK